MPHDPSPSLAPGAPGSEPLWSRAAKDGVGTAYHTGCRVWFTLAQGIVTEVYCPTVDTPNTRDLQFLVTDGETFVHEEKNDLQHHTEMPEPGALFYRITNTAPDGRYRLVKEVLTDPHSSVLLLRLRLEIPDESLRGKLRIFALLAPHLGGHGADNNAGWLDLGERTLLRAEREDTHLVFGCDRGFAKRSVGYVGASDGWQDLHKGNFQMDWQYRQAGPGTVALMGEINLGGSDDPEIHDPAPDGAPFDDAGEGRCWPILTGERGHDELAAGRDAMPFVRTMEGFANETGLLPEQIWDAADLPECHQLFVRPSGSAMPLCWSHAEYISLVRSVRDGQWFDRIEPAFQRYTVEGKRDCSHDIWTFRHRTRRVPAGRTLRLLVKAAAGVHWTTDAWSSMGQADATASGFGGLHYFDVPTGGLTKGARVEWTFIWKDADRWEGENFQVEIV